MKKIFLPLLLLSVSWCIGTAQIQNREQFVTTSDGVSLYVKTAGEGPACLYLHGGPGSGSWWLEKFSGEFLEKHFRMIYLDQRGTARSSSPADGNYTPERFAQDFEEVRKALGIDQWLTLGHSFAGILQMVYTEAYPAPQLGMIMMNCTLSWNDSIENGWLKKVAEWLDEPDASVLACDTISLRERLRISSQKLSEKDIFWKLHYADPDQKKIMDATFGEISNWNNDFGNAIMNEIELWDKNYTEDTRNITLPVLFFYGKTDWAIGPEHYKKVHFPNMILWGNDGGHVPFLENREDFEEAVETYIKTYNF